MEDVQKASGTGLFAGALSISTGPRRGLACLTEEKDTEN